MKIERHVVLAFVAVFLLASGVALVPLVARSSPAGAVTALGCTIESGLDVSMVRLTGLVEGTPLELFVDGARLERSVALGATHEFGVFAEDTQPHVVTVRIDGLAARTIECGTAQVPSSFPSDLATCSIDGVVDGAPRIDYRSARDNVVLVRNGEVLAVRREVPSTFVDLSARPSTRYRYALRFVGAQPTREIPGGSVTTPARTTAQRLATARYFESIQLAPYVYTTMRPTCAGCDEPFTTLSSVSDPTVSPTEDCEPTDLSCFPDYVFDPPIVEQVTLPGGHPGLYPPRALGRVLAAAITAGKKVEFTTDGFGLLISWSIDGYGAEISCTEFDTAPPELRTGPCTEFTRTELVRDAPNLASILRARDTPGAARGILRLYDAYFGRTPDVGGARYWIDLNAQGLSPATIGDLFVASRESQLSWHAETTSAFLDRIYANVFDRRPDAEGAAYWTAQIDNGLSRGQVIWWFAQSTEFRGQHPYSLGDLAGS